VQVEATKDTATDLLTVSFFLLVL